MNIKKHIKSIILSAGMVVFQIFSPQNKPSKKIKSEVEEESDISQADMLKFQANAIKYNPTTKAILHQYYKLYDEKCTVFENKTSFEPYVTGIVGKRYPLKDIQRVYFSKTKRIKKL